MCGRFSLGATAATLAQQFGLHAPPTWLPRYNIAPTQEVLAVCRPPAGADQVARTLRWGLIPPWATNPGTGNRLINARAETVFEKPAFRRGIRDRRCLIPADAFFEWEARGRGKRPWCIRMRDSRPFAFAGLWERWVDPAHGTVDSCTILTTTPNPLLEQLHPRMPVILWPEAYDLWLDPSTRDPDRLRHLFLPFPLEQMRAYPVRSLVNNPANDSPECLLPID